MSGSYVVLVEFGLAVFFHSVAIVQILLILRSNVRKNISLFFMALLLNWLCAALLLLPYEIHAVISWRPKATDALNNGTTLFFIAMPAHLLLSSIPVSVLFLTIDRICIIRLGHNYGYKIKRLLKMCFFGTLLVGMLFNLGGMLSAVPVPTQTDCEIFGCILGTSVQFYLGWRAFCAIFNTTSGTLFFFVFYRSNKKMASTTAMLSTAGLNQIRRANRANNLLTCIAIVSELFLSFLPHFLPFVWEMFFGAGSSLGTGPLSEFMSSVDVLLFSTIYSHLFSARDDGSAHGTAATQQQQQRQQQQWRMEMNINNNFNMNERRRSDRIFPMQHHLNNYPQQKNMNKNVVAAAVQMPDICVIPAEENRPKTSTARY